MRSQVRHGLEGGTTILTDVWLGNLMADLMSSQGVLLVEGSIAMTALERTLPTVDHVMALQMLLGSEGFVALIT